MRASAMQSIKCFGANGLGKIHRKHSPNLFVVARIMAESRRIMADSSWQCAKTRGFCMVPGRSKPGRILAFWRTLAWQPVKTRGICSVLCRFGARGVCANFGGVVAPPVARLGRGLERFGRKLTIHRCARLRDRAKNCQLLIRSREMVPWPKVAEFWPNLFFGIGHVAKTWGFCMAQDRMTGPKFTEFWPSRLGHM